MSKNKASSFVSLPSQIVEPINLDALEQWTESEISHLDKDLQPILRQVCKNLDYFIRWPSKAELLWKGAFRAKPNIYFEYPDELKRQIESMDTLRPNTLSNGPAIMSFLLAGGERPTRFAKNSAWHIHHIYFKEFPYKGRKETLHAVKEGNHFTQSAGLVAIHSIANTLCDEYPFFSWRLRAEAFQKFGYDPDHVFTPSQVDEYGFATGYSTIIRYKEGNFFVDDRFGKSVLMG
jgi:hypothetical protein